MTRTDDPKLLIVPPGSIPATLQPGQEPNRFSPTPTPNNPQPVTSGDISDGAAVLKLYSTVIGTDISFGSGSSVIKPIDPPAIDTSGGWDPFTYTWAPGVAGRYLLSIMITFVPTLVVPETPVTFVLSMFYRDVAHPGPIYSIAGQQYTFDLNVGEIVFVGTSVALGLQPDSRVRFEVANAFIDGGGIDINVEFTEIVMRSFS